MMNLNKKNRNLQFVNYSVIHDHEYEMLVIGKNVDNEYLIGSFLEEIDEERRIYYLHIFSNDTTYLNFLQGKISYLEVVKTATEIYKVCKKYNYEIAFYEKINFSDLSEDELPLETSFFPRPNLETVIIDLKKRIAIAKEQIIWAELVKRISIQDSSQYGVTVIHEVEKNLNKNNRSKLKSTQDYVPKASRASSK